MFLPAPSAIAGAVLTLVICGPLRAAESSVDFASQIAPILQRHCVRCHSPDNSEGGISLETIDDLMSGDYVVPGVPEASGLLELVTPQDDSPAAMPKDAAPLGAGDVALLGRWIAQGATWPRDIVVKERSMADASWWAFQPIDVPDKSSPKSPSTIDGLIRAKLAEHQLRISPPADRRTLIRRVSFDLVGLPPAPDEVEAFVNDPDPQAYEKLVDRLLASPHYGERYARHWLDLAHYADTHGFERDMRRDTAWRYRDYVIESFNDDKPYDRFLQEQVAGDVLWPDDDQAVVATGFLSAGPWDYVGHVETKSAQLRRSARALDLDDMTTQVMATTMALTVNCARCHDHKLDPISQREYYQLQSVFAGLEREERLVSQSALQDYETQQQRLIARRDEIDFQLRRLEGDGIDLADIVGGGNGSMTGAFRQGIDPRTAKVQTRDFGKLGNVVTNRFSESEFEFVDGVFIPDGDGGRAEIPVSSTGVTIRGLPSTSGNAWDMIRNGPVASQHSPALDGIDFTQGGRSVLGLHANAGITFDVAAIGRQLMGATDAGTQATTAPLRFTALLGYFGAAGSHHADVWVFADGLKLAEFRNLKRDDGLQSIDLQLAPSVRFLTLVATDGGNGFSHDQIGFGDPRIRCNTPRQSTDAQTRRIAALRSARKHVTAELDTLGPPPRFYGVVASAEVPEVRLLSRGDPESATGDALAPAALSALAMLDPKLGTPQTGDGQRRAALARWITDTRNPLTRRVIVNRLWHWHFGQGLVDTPSDFGFGGSRPSHPELLDWLAEELVRHDWSLKAMHRLILTSRTYRQSSHVSERSGQLDESAMRIDADNRLLWRQNPRRLEAEAIRDAVLFASGNLNLRRGGPGFEDFDYQDAYAPIYTYKPADDASLWRRSIYRFIVRTTPDRFLTTLDCPDPANMTPKRITTTTPLQSLALYNNDFMLRQARYFARRVEREAGVDVAKQVERAFRLALARSPSDREAKLAGEFVSRESLFALCRSLFNLNEFVYVD
ncbi:DUF1553 domain-containing protein [Rhodopirellula sp. JC639]|uniref:DUF1553 domain-containing protein n=1 Tax=Stieleria mannarensis TaxID=2755585 RepID=UPI0016024F97|nr:DUF1553 domain-containing protein [Rhodopirellula sp. JC639]